MHVSEFFKRLRAVARGLAEEHALSLNLWVDLDAVKVESHGAGYGAVTFEAWHPDLTGRSGFVIINWHAAVDRRKVLVCPNGGGRVVEIDLGDVHEASRAEGLRRGRESQQAAVCAAVDRNWVRRVARGDA